MTRCTGVARLATLLWLGACASPPPYQPPSKTDSGDPPGCETPLTWFEDVDQDGFGAGTPIQACDPPAGYVGIDGDCDDDAADITPGTVLNAVTTTGTSDSLWLDESLTTQQGSPWVVANANGEPSHHATVALGADGHALVVWQDGTSQVRAFGALYDELGNTIVPQFSLTSTSSSSGKPDVEADEDSYLVTWQSSDGGIFLRRYNQSAQPISDEVLVYNDGGVGEAPDVGVLANGEVVVVWNVDGIPNEIGADYYRHFQPDLQPMTPPTSLMHTGRSVADVAGLAGGGFVVVGTNLDTPNNGQDAEVYGRIIDKNGCIRHFQADDGASPWPSRPTVAAAEDGRFAVIWRNKIEEGLANGVYFRLFDPDGRALGPQRQVLDDSNNANRPVARFAGDLLVAGFQANTLATNDVHMLLLAPVTGALMAPRLNLSEAGNASGERPSIGLRTHANGEIDLVTSWEAGGPEDRSVLLVFTKVLP
ncbi:MAG: hypothetical protein GWP91_10335 [Rhodobacterales bacterium]|nr:hypothetical protein [Rhodobacterales bacterium]